MQPPAGTALGQPSEYPRTYSPELLCPVSRAANREDLRLSAELPFSGVDIWNAYEVSWLDDQGKPEAALGEIVFPASSPQLIESKSLKLYLNSINQTRFGSLADLQQTLRAELSAAAGDEVSLTLVPVGAVGAASLGVLPGDCLDNLRLAITDYDPNPELLGNTGAAAVSEALHTHLFKSNCPVTGQPDWASVLIRYRGPAIDHAALLRYLISYRNCSAFHEHCVESIFMDLLRRCQPEALTVYARYCRRGGLDINPFRSNFEAAPDNLRLARQ